MVESCSQTFNLNVHCQFSSACGGISFFKFFIWKDSSKEHCQIYWRTHFFLKEGTLSNNPFSFYPTLIFVPPIWNISFPVHHKLFPGKLPDVYNTNHLKASVYNQRSNNSHSLINQEPHGPWALMSDLAFSRHETWTSLSLTPFSKFLLTAHDVVSRKCFLMGSLVIRGLSAGSVVRCCCVTHRQLFTPCWISHILNYSEATDGQRALCILLIEY